MVLKISLPSFPSSFRSRFIFFRFFRFGFSDGVVSSRCRRVRRGIVVFRRRKHARRSFLPTTSVGAVPILPRRALEAASLLVERHGIVRAFGTRGATFRRSAVPRSRSFPLQIPAVEVVFVVVVPLLSRLVLLPTPLEGPVPIVLLIRLVAIVIEAILHGPSDPVISVRRARTRTPFPILGSTCLLRVFLPLFWGRRPFFLPSPQADPVPIKSFRRCVTLKVFAPVDHANSGIPLWWSTLRLPSRFAHVFRPNVVSVIDRQLFLAAELAFRSLVHACRNALRLWPAIGKRKIIVPTGLPSRRNAAAS